MRPPTFTSNVGGRLVFAALTVILSWQMHISVSGMKVPLWPIAVAFVFLTAVVLFSKNRWVLLGAAITAQALVHFGSDFAMNQIMGHHHMPDTVNFAMFAAHTFAAVVGWIVLTQGEMLFEIARTLFARFFSPLFPVASSIQSAAPIRISTTATFINRFIYVDISRRGPPAVA